MLRLDGDAPTLLYVAEPTCRSCSADLEALKRILPPTIQVVLVPPAADQDQALRGVVSLYRYAWPYAVGTALPAALRLTPPAALLVARGGFSGAMLRPPFNATLPVAVEVMTKAEVRESVPRADWNKRPVERPSPAPRATLLDSGFAPGEDEPAPPEFVSAVGAFRAARPARPCGSSTRSRPRATAGCSRPRRASTAPSAWPPWDGARRRAACLLHTGDSRFQDDRRSRAREASARPGAKTLSTAGRFPRPARVESSAPLTTKEEP